MSQSKLFPKFIIVSVLGVVAFMVIGFFSSIFINKILEDKTESFIAPKNKIRLIKLSVETLPLERRQEFINKVNLQQREVFTLINKNDDFNCDVSSCQRVEVDNQQSLIVLERSGLLADIARRKRPKKIRSPLNNLFLTTGVQFVAMIFYVVILLFLIFYYARKRRELEEEVFEKIKQGSLDARFPTSRADDFGTNTKLFNEMADEIMNLVLELRKKDENRKLLFKTLAHDLKTPAASLKGIMETLTLRENELSVDQKNELYKMSSMEIDYFSSLLDDILFLAKVQDPEFKNVLGKSELVSLLRDISDSFSFLNSDIELSFSSNVEEAFITLEHNSLMRLLRNALDNAFAYGKSRVSVDIQLQDTLIVSIKNDGDGFDEQAIKNFGTMKNSRTRTNAQGSLSFGMGAVIMSAIVECIDGKITPQNIKSSAGDIIGSNLIIEIPV